MQDLARWLEKLGMSEYGECFPENKIDLSVLPHLTRSRTLASRLGIGGRCWQQLVADRRQEKAPRDGGQRGFSDRKLG